MTTLTPVVVEETFGDAGDDFATFALWEAALPADLTVEVSGQTCEAMAADSGHIVLHDTAVATDDFYTGLVVEWSGEQRRITDYVGSTKTCTIGALNGGAATFSGTPQANDAFTVYPVVMKGLAHAHDVNALMTIAGQTTDADAHVWLAAKAGASWRDTATPATEEIDRDGTTFRNTHNPGSTNQNLLLVNTPYTVVEGLQLWSSGGQTRVTQLNLAGANTVFRDGQVRDSTGNLQRRNLFTLSGAGATMVNSALWWNSGQSFGQWSRVCQFQGGAKMVNCGFYRPTVLGTSAQAIVRRDGDCEFRSTAFYGNWGSFQTSSTGAITIDHCATNLASFGTISAGANNITSGSNTGDLEDIATDAGDGRAKAGGNLESAGAVETDTDYGAGRVDVFGNARHATAPTIGPFELPAAGGGETVAIGVGRDAWGGQAVVVNARENLVVGAGIDAWAGTALVINEKTVVPVPAGVDLGDGKGVTVRADEAVAVDVGRDTWTGMPLTVRSAEAIGVGRVSWQGTPLIVNAREAVAIGAGIDAWAGTALTVTGGEVVTIGVGRVPWRGTGLRLPGNTVYAGLHALTDVVPGNKEDLRDGRL